MYLVALIYFKTFKFFRLNLNTNVRNSDILLIIYSNPLFMKNLIFRYLEAYRYKHATKQNTMIELHIFVIF